MSSSGSFVDSVMTHPFFQAWVSKYDTNAETFLERGNVYQILLDLTILAFVFYVVFRRPEKEEKPLTEKEIKEVIDEWQPEEMFPRISERERKLESNIPTISGVEGPYVLIDNKKVLNLVRTDFHGFLTNPDVVKAAQDCVYTYGTGTCGPRQFYGTIDVHLKFEEKIAKFMGTEAAILYSYGFATVSSVIPAFAGRSDVILADEAVSFPIQTGLNLSRAEIIYFKHNDVQDLEKWLVKITTDKKRKLTRRFIAIEGVYHNVGDIAPLDKIVALKEKYKFRLFMDDSLGIGVIGKTGRGTCEYHNLPATKVEFITANLASATSSVGGFCVGDRNAVYHQTLHSSGYVYSASLPPLLAIAANKSFEIVDKNPKLIQELAKKSQQAFERLSKLEGMVISGQKDSPVMHLRLKNPLSDRFDNEEILQDIVDEALQQGLFLTRAKYSIGEHKIPQPSIRIFISNSFNSAEFEKALNIIESATKAGLAKNAQRLGKTSATVSPPSTSSENGSARKRK